MERTRVETTAPPLPMRLLAAGVPLSLLIDLVAPGGPDSELIAASEQAGRR